MIKSLLVAIDGSVHSENVVRYAAFIAESCDAKLIILAVVKAHKVPKMSVELRAYADMEHISGSDLDSMKMIAKGVVDDAKKLAMELGVKDVAAIVDSGPVARSIVATASQKKVDIIVVGSRGMGNIEATLRGGVSHRVGLLAKCSVLTVK